VKRETEAWLASAERDAAAARLLAVNGFCGQAVFYTHLWVEKTLKALVVEHSPMNRARWTHDLVTLLYAAGHSEATWMVPFLVRLSNESIASRYTLPPDSSRYTADYAGELLEGAEEATGWLKQQLM
jgi:HEPN domain-containing protein